MYYVVVDIGCMHCNERSSVLGIFTNRNRAEYVCEEHKARQADDWSGEHEFEVYEIAEIDTEYKVDYND
jgi:hypothetical protein